MVRRKFVTFFVTRTGSEIPPEAVGWRSNGKRLSESIGAFL